MNTRTVIMFLVVSSELFSSNSQNKFYSQSNYNNREFLNSFKNCNNKSDPQSNSLTLSQKTVKKFINQKDDYLKNKLKN